MCSEVKHVKDVFASDFSHAEIIGKNVRLVWTVPSCRAEGAPKENLRVAQLIVPVDAVRAMVRRLLFAVGQDATNGEAIGPISMHLH